MLSSDVASVHLRFCSWSSVVCHFALWDVFSVCSWKLQRWWKHKLKDVSPFCTICVVHLDQGWAKWDGSVVDAWGVFVCFTKSKTKIPFNFSENSRKSLEARLLNSHFSEKIILLSLQIVCQTRSSSCPFLG